MYNENWENKLNHIKYGITTIFYQKISKESCKILYSNTNALLIGTLQIWYLFHLVVLTSIFHSLILLKPNLWDSWWMSYKMTAVLNQNIAYIPHILNDSNPKVAGSNPPGDNFFCFLTGFWVFVCTYFTLTYILRSLLV